MVFYFEASADGEGLLAAVEDAGYEATLVRGDAADPETAVVE